jgi:hypothetical protein
VGAGDDEGRGGTAGIAVDYDRKDTGCRYDNRAIKTLTHGFSIIEAADHN